MAFSNKKQLNSMVSSIQSLEDTIETKQDFINTLPIQKQIVTLQAKEL